VPSENPQGICTEAPVPGSALAGYGSLLEARLFGDESWFRLLIRTVLAGYLASQPDPSTSAEVGNAAKAAPLPANLTPAMVCSSSK